MDPAVKEAPVRGLKRAVLALTAIAPVLPQVLGSLFNIWYNAKVVDPLLTTLELKTRFFQTVVVYNAVVYPVAIFFWVRLVFSLRPTLQKLQAGEPVPRPELARTRRRVVNLPWWGALLTGVSWLGCIPVFLTSIAMVGDGLDPLFWWHFPISIIVATLISVTHGIFCIELISYWGLFPVFFRERHADLPTGGLALSLRWRGVLWAISIGICPIGSLLLLGFAPSAPGSNPQWFAVFVGSVGIAFGLCTAVMMSSLVARPIDILQSAAREVAEGRFDRRLHATRPDEFGQLLAAFDHMIDQLREKERLRQTFGLHVGKTAAEQILARNPGLGGVEQTITVMFVDIRAFTARSAAAAAPEVVGELNEFLRLMVYVVEEQNGGMINKFLGDGFMALFGVGGDERHAAAALKSGRDILQTLLDLNRTMEAVGRPPLKIGVGIHTGPAVVGSIGSPQRLEFTAIGNTVNIAARIEQLTKLTGCSVLLSEDTFRHLDDGGELVALEPQVVRGLERPIVVYAAEIRVAPES